MKINQFFTDVLGATVRNQRWSWGAFDPITNRVFLRVWADTIKTHHDGERVHVASDKPRRKSNGFKERQLHLEQVQKGAECYGVVCTASDPKTAEVRKIESFDQESLLRLGDFVKQGGNTYARILEAIPVEDVLRQRTAHSTLSEDLKSIFKRKIESTTKDALVSARIGQGQFRASVLQLWGNRCAVTRSTTKDAIRASHIQPWCESNDDERLDPHYGLPLVASLDALFDAGLITFESSGRMAVSPFMSHTEREIFGLTNASLVSKPAAKTADYLAYHRQHRFRTSVDPPKS